MKKVEMKVYFKNDIEKVFNVITNMKDCSWRSDLSKVECIDDGKYIEVKCHFCNTAYTFSVDELKELLKKSR